MVQEIFAMANFVENVEIPMPCYYSGLKGRNPCFLGYFADEGDVGHYRLW